MSWLRDAMLAAALLTATACGAADGPKLGHPASPSDLAPWDISIAPDGLGLPPGQGTAVTGEQVFMNKCQACHGEKGAGKPNDVLVGGIGSLGPGKAAVKTVGSYWPYATTLFDYIRRAMPFNEPKSLTAEEVYGVSAYILALNGVIGPNEVLDANSLPRVRMPNKDGFVAFPR